MIPEPSCVLASRLIRAIFSRSCFRVHDIDGQIRPVESADECFRFAEAELLDDVRANVRRGRRGERQSLHFRPETGCTPFSRR